MLSRLWSWIKGEDKKNIVSSQDLDDKIKTALINLGETSDQIAEKLCRVNITGVCRDVFSCPIATYLRLISPCNPGQDIYVVVSGASYAVSYYTKPPCDGFWTVAQGPLPEPVQEFIRLFDKGIYKDLLSEK